MISFLPNEIVVIILAGLVMVILLKIEELFKDNKKLCQRCQKEIRDHKWKKS